MAPSTTTSSTSTASRTPGARAPSDRVGVRWRPPASGAFARPRWVGRPPFRDPGELVTRGQQVELVDAREEQSRDIGADLDGERAVGACSIAAGHDGRLRVGRTGIDERVTQRERSRSLDGDRQGDGLAEHDRGWGLHVDGEHRRLAELPVARFERIALGTEGVRLRELSRRIVAGEEEWPVRDDQQVGLVEPVDAGLIAGLRVIDGDQIAAVQVEDGLGERFVPRKRRMVRMTSRASVSVTKLNQGTLKRAAAVSEYAPRRSEKTTSSMA